MDKIKVITGVERKRRFTEEEKRSFVAEMKSSSLASVGRKYGIANSVLHNWKKKYGDSAFATVKVASNQEVSKPLLTTSAAAAAATIKVHFPPSCTLEFPANISPSFLADFIKRLRVLS